LARHAPHLQPPPDPVRQDLQETGREVGVLARDLFPEGFALAVGESRRESLLQKTREALRSGAGTLYEPAFESNGAWFRADILHRGKNG
ncbi:MAG: DUF2779 domain-containing protein, partial [Nitrospinaceae bacterium]|nr:DUF2779 domain-containing protein [Nitrospinaceae bacterium]NIR56407.1 DUF2779 domain-containing protein [Nitrospinaceae bacterium]NIS86871.1 DUF2779 domain-containing protein [Nitrospinaceae bacterium]NIT83707.1 DUF2779 domain-containing protein [Nitrospinaceae bacterium]NIU45908.1 DUF2779 domain-containing protein [Nitrospinaceae bacterium]